MASSYTSVSEGITLWKHRIVIFIHLLTLIVIIAVSAANAQPQKPEIESGATIGSPDVEITRVTNRGIVGDDSSLVIRVEWSARARQTTEFLGFIASVDVEYADGTKNSDTRSVGATARQADLRIINKGANTPRKFTARVATQFKFLDANFINRSEEFVLNKANGFTALSSPSSTPRPSGEAFAISRVRAKFNDCAPAKHCFIIEWGTTPRPSVQLQDVSLSAQIAYTPGSQTRSATASAPASARTITLAVDDLKTEIANIKITLTQKVSATITTNKSTQLTGNF